ncbi:RNA ligase family protein [Fischerella sp. JS2]|uniref:RNA ligase family protein n=1 Tax=Fischerella sp. JS2 TaxID=2597771 RepID=UPI0028E4CDEA|nr:RNA ligase family protein [Fischerella sp. JS2]
MDVVSSDTTEWKSITYEKIPENLHQWQLTESDYWLFKKTDWVVTEKIHGANFGITTNGLEVRFARRKEFLQLGEDFFNYLSLRTKLAQQAKEIFWLLQPTTQLQRIYIYGELFGGEYPHPEVKAVPGVSVQAVQTGVYYSPKIEYYAFDIAILENQTSLEKTYLNYDHALDLFHQVGMMSAESLFIGKYEDAMAYSIEFESKIPETLGLPKLTFANKAEGIVIKPLKTIYLLTSKGNIRPVIKKKIPVFSEDSRFHQAKKWNFQQLPLDKGGLSI